MKPYFNYSVNFALSWVDKVTTGTWNSVLVIANFTPWFAVAVETAVTQFANQARMKLIWPLIWGISRVPQKLLKYFKDTFIWIL